MKIRASEQQLLNFKSSFDLLLLKTTSQRYPPHVKMTTYTYTYTYILIDGPRNTDSPRTEQQTYCWFSQLFRRSALCIYHSGAMQKESKYFNFCLIILCLLEKKNT